MIMSSDWCRDGSNERSGSAASDTNSTIILTAAALAALTVFALDTWVSVRDAVAVLYVLVVLTTVTLYRRSYVVIVTGACVALTLLSYAITHGGEAEPAASIRMLVSILSILITAMLVMKVVSTTYTLRQTERRQANLSRFFSPQLVDQIAEADVPLSQSRHQSASIMFVDMVGFTSYCDRMSPEAVVEMLRDILKILGDCVFARNGTIDKFTGDGVMAVFGLPFPSQSDGTNAALCALEILEVVETWNTRAGRKGSLKIQVGVGIHYGDVVQADVGSEQRLELTTFGDAVNVACRVEAFTRQLDASVLVTKSFVALLEREGAEALVAEFHDLGRHQLRGRTDLTHLFGKRRQAAAAG
ncbi:adenylate/guanylate cyclase domain-containing protein [Methylobacterium soli]|nr:adenylate/guanylate cyclase domain-containing protein [Methylobacterium soli]GJE44649.1 hypothetical protein AEGHOMDF_3838 [Methylobacterium soli]